MTKEELLLMPRKKMDKWDLYSDLMRFESYFMPIDIYGQNFHENEFEDVEIFGIFEKMVDHERGGWIRLTKFQGKNLFLTQRAGRGGDDHYKIFFFDRGLLADFFSYMRKFLVDDFENLPMMTDEVMPEVTSFYGYDLDKEMLDLDLPLKYAEGDMVNVCFSEFKGGKNVSLRGVVTKADPKTTAKTYHIELLDFMVSFDAPPFSVRERDVVPKYNVAVEPPKYSEMADDRKAEVKRILREERKGVGYTLSYNEEDTLLSPL